MLPQFCNELFLTNALLNKTFELNSIVGRHFPIGWGFKKFLIHDNGPVMAAGEHIFEGFEYDSTTSGSFHRPDCGNG